MATWMPGPVRGCLADTPPAPPSISRRTWALLPGRGCFADPLPTLQFHDTFTDTDGVLLDAHTPDLGTGWSLANAYPANVQLQIGGNKLVTATGGSVGGTEHVADQLIPDVVIEATTVCVDDPGSPSWYNGAAIVFRGMTNTLATRWAFGCTPGYVILSNSSGTSYYDYTFNANTDIPRAMRVELAGTYIKCFVDDVLIFDKPNQWLYDAGTWHGVRLWNNGGPSGSLDDFKITAAI